MADSTGRAEQWREIPGWEGFYEVSTKGRVRSVDRVVIRRDGTRLPLRGRLRVVTPTSREDPRPRVLLCRPGLVRSYLVHTLVLVAFVGPRPDGQLGCHGNGDCTDNRLENLRWDTPSANAQDMLRHGTHEFKNRSVCPRGHTLALPNLMRAFWARGHRNCLACSRAKSNRQVARRHGDMDFDWVAAADRHYATIMGQSTG